MGRARIAKMETLLKCPRVSRCAGSKWSTPVSEFCRNSERQPKRLSCAGRNRPRPSRASCRTRRREVGGGQGRPLPVLQCCCRSARCQRAVFHAGRGGRWTNRPHRRRRLASQLWRLNLASQGCGAGDVRPQLIEHGHRTARRGVVIEGFHGEDQAIVAGTLDHGGRSRGCAMRGQELRIDRQAGDLFGLNQGRCRSRNPDSWRGPAAATPVCSVSPTSTRPRVTDA